MYQAKTYIIDLDEKPERRWRKVINDHIDHFGAVEREIDLILSGVGAFGGIAKFVTSTFSTFGKVMYKKELQGISKMTGIKMSKLILMQICYEMFAACTSIVIKGNKYNYHFRTMDWEMDFLKNLTINAEFIKGGKTLFKATTWAGYVGIATAVNNDYSIALNYRRSDGTLLGNIWRTMKMKWPVGYLIRYIFENNVTSSSARSLLRTTQLISPCYITFCTKCGPACVIMRNKDSVADEKVLGSNGSNGYLIQTNHDTIKTSYANIMESFERYTLAEKILKEKFKFNSEGVCVNATQDKILEEFHVRPIINSHTIYSSIIVPSKYLLKAYVVSDYSYVDGNFKKFMNIDLDKVKKDTTKCIPSVDTDLPNTMFDVDLDEPFDDYHVKEYDDL